MKKLSVAFLLIHLMISSIAQGDDSDGCGLGWQVTQRKSFLGTSTRGTTNLTLPPTLGMTSGTMGCSRHSIAKTDEAAATFTIFNFENLRIEMARGSGENLAAFAQVLNCRDANAFGSFTQSHYGSIMDGAAESPLRMLENLRRLNPCGA